MLSPFYCCVVLCCLRFIVVLSCVVSVLLLCFPVLCSFYCCIVLCCLRFIVVLSCVSSFYCCIVLCCLRFIAVLSCVVFVLLLHCPVLSSFYCCVVLCCLHLIVVLSCVVFVLLLHCPLLSSFCCCIIMYSGSALYHYTNSSIYKYSYRNRSVPMPETDKARPLYADLPGGRNMTTFIKLSTRGATHYFSTATSYKRCATSAHLYFIW